MFRSSVEALFGGDGKSARLIAPITLWMMIGLGGGNVDPLAVLAGAGLTHVSLSSGILGSGVFWKSAKSKNDFCFGPFGDGVLANTSNRESSALVVLGGELGATCCFTSGRGTVFVRSVVILKDIMELTPRSRCGR